MKNYYVRFENVYVRIDNDTKEIVNVLNLPIQKTISKINNQQYYDNALTHISTWTIIDEISFNEKYNEVLTYLNNI